MQIFSMQDESPRAQATTKGINPDKPDRSQDLRQGKRIYWLDTARFIAIIAITSTHALHRAFLGPAEGISAGENIFRGIIQPFCRLGVPLFLMISGALLLNRRMENDSDISRFYRHNLLSVFITSEIWFFIMFWFRTLGHANDFLSHGMAYTLGRLAGTMLFVNQETMDSMWYMPMILCIYMLIPWVNLAVHKVKVKYIALPALIVIISSMIIPNINELIRITGGKTNIHFALQAGNLFSMYLVFVILGYYIRNGLLSHIPTVAVSLICACSFIIICIYQTMRYSVYTAGDIKYNSVFITITAAMVFELIRRKMAAMHSKGIEYISRISFGIYFVHILILTVLCRLPVMAGFGHIPKFFIYEILSIALSVIFIFLTSKSGIIRKYFYMIR